MPDLQLQAEDVLLLKLTQQLRPQIPTLFLDTGYHFAETYAYRDQITREWKLNLINLKPAQTVEQQEAEHGLLYQTAPDQCCGSRKVAPLFAAVGRYKVWLTGLRREQARSRAHLTEVADFALPNGKIVRKLSPFAHWSVRDIWQLAEHFKIPLLPLYAQGYTSIGCHRVLRYLRTHTILVPAAGAVARLSAAFTCKFSRPLCRT